MILRWNPRTAFHRAEIFNYDSYEKWYEEGAETSEQSAAKKVKKMLREYEVPALDPAIDEALQAYVAKRKEEIPPEF